MRYQGGKSRISAQIARLISARGGGLALSAYFAGPAPWRARCKAFAMLVGVVGLFESQRRFEMFRAHDFEIMYFNRRVAYFKSYEDPAPSLNPPFSSVYVCKGILPKTIVFEEIAKR